MTLLKCHIPKFHYMKNCMDNLASLSKANDSMQMVEPEKPTDRLQIMSKIGAIMRSLEYIFSRTITAP